MLAGGCAGRTIPIDGAGKAGGLLGEIMKDLEGNSAHSCQRELIINVYSLKVFRSPAVQGMYVCTYLCACVRVHVCKYKG